MAGSSVLKPQLPDRALEFIGSKKDGLLQSELRKLLGHREQQVFKDSVQADAFRADKTA